LKSLSRVTSAAAGFFFRAREDGLVMRRLFFSGDDGDLNLFQTRHFQPAVQIAFGAPSPAIWAGFCGNRATR